MTAGVVWALSAAMVFAVGQIFVRKGVSTLGVTLGTALMVIVGALTVIVTAFILEGTQFLRMAGGLALLYFAAAGLFHFLVGWSFLNASTRLIGAARTSAIVAVTPLFAAVLAIIALHEQINVYLVIGILMITGGTYFITTG